MSNPFAEREGDAQSRRRRLLDADGRKEFDSHYGQSRASGSAARNSGGAGKGDAPRTNTAPRLFELGMELTRQDLTDDEREQLEREWYGLRGVSYPGDASDGDDELSDCDGAD